MKTNKDKVRKEKLSEPHLVLKKEAEFGFTYYENVQNIAMAFAQAGRYVKIRREGTSYLLELYVHS